MTTFSISDLRNKISEIANKVAYQGERVRIDRNGKPIAGIVSIEDIEFLEALEERIDVEAAKKALKRGKFIPLKRLKKELGL